MHTTTNSPLPRLILAYRTGAMHYGIFTLTKVEENGAAPGQSTQQKPADRTPA